MKKIRILSLISLLLVCAMVLTAFTPAFASTDGTEPKAIDLRIDLTPLKETDRASYYVFVGARLLQSFPTNLIQTEYGQKEIILYPREYAGAYLDHSGTLHIMLTKDANIATKNNYQAIMGSDKDIIYEYADFSLCRLYEIQRTLDGVIQKFSIQSTGVIQTDNRVEISLFDNSQQQALIELLKAKFDDFNVGCIVFIDPIDAQLTDDDTASNALAGSDTTSSAGGAATLGFNAYRHATGQAGVITAGHYATAGTTIYNAVGTTIGSETVRLQGNQSGGYDKIDAAFIPFPTSITYSYKLSGNYASPDNCITHYYPDDTYLFEGQPTHKIGSATGITFDSLKQISQTIVINGIAYTDQVRTGNQQLGGDSGGPVFHTVSQAGTDFHILIGIATIRSGAHALASKVGNINSEFGVTPFYGT